MRIIFYAGKGGVGKTSVAAATGIRTAELGHRTIIMSLDVAHSLSDIFDLDAHLLDQNKGKPIEVQNNLWIQELDIQEEIETNWGDIHKYIATLLNTTGLDEILAEELAILPGMEEVSLLLYINRFVQEKAYDVIILDCAPTGESLRFISIPTTLEWYIKKLFNMERTLAKFARPLAKKLYDIPLPDDTYFASIERLFKRLKGVDQILTDPQITTVRLVTNPEKIVLRETQRAFMYFCLYKMNIDGVIINRVLPNDIRDRYFEDWRKSQRNYMEKAKQFFDPIPIFSVRLFRDEVLGYDRLKVLADTIYKNKTPVDRFFKGEPYRLKKENGEYQLKMTLPFIQKKDIELNKFSDELIIKVGGYKKHILLPRQVASMKKIKADFEGKHLNIHFRGAHHE